jgi:hypothetical protein
MAGLLSASRAGAYGWHTTDSDEYKSWHDAWYIYKYSPEFALQAMQYVTTAVTMLRMTGVLYEVTKNTHASCTGHVCKSMKQYERILISIL